MSTAARAHGQMDKSVRFYVYGMATSVLLCLSLVTVYFAKSVLHIPVDMIGAAVFLYLLCGGSIQSARPSLLVLPFAYMGQMFLLIKDKGNELGMTFGLISGAMWVVATASVLLVSQAFPPLYE